MNEIILEARNIHLQGGMYYLYIPVELIRKGIVNPDKYYRVKLEEVSK